MMVRWTGAEKARASSATVRSSTSEREPNTIGPASGTIPRSRRRIDPSVSRPRARCASTISTARDPIVGIVRIADPITNVSRRPVPRRSRSARKSSVAVVRLKTATLSANATTRRTACRATVTPVPVAANGPTLKSTSVAPG